MIYFIKLKNTFSNRHTRRKNVTNDIETMINRFKLLLINVITYIQKGINELNNRITLSDSAGRSFKEIFELIDITFT